MDLDIKDWMIIVGVLLIVAVLLDGYRRMRAERRESIRLSIKGGKDSYADDDEFFSNPELPGPVRKVSLHERVVTPHDESANPASVASPQSLSRRAPDFKAQQASPDSAAATKPTAKPLAKPVSKPSVKPSAEPMAEPSAEPMAQPSVSTKSADRPFIDDLDWDNSESLSHPSTVSSAEKTIAGTAQTSAETDHSDDDRAAVQQSVDNSDGLKNQPLPTKESAGAATSIESADTEPASGADRLPENSVEKLDVAADSELPDGVEAPQEPVHRPVSNPLASKPYRRELAEKSTDSAAPSSPVSPSEQLKNGDNDEGLEFESMVASRDEGDDSEPTISAELRRAETQRVDQQHELWDEPAPDEVPAPEFEDLIILNVVAKDGVFQGPKLLKILLACDLRLGRMNIFHRYEEEGGRGAEQFSVVNLVAPGTFDLDAIDEFESPGVSFFMRLPGPTDTMMAFTAMHETAQALVKNLDGELQDESHSVATTQTLSHYKQRIVDFERKQLTLS